jgi:hypothetical protein
MYSCKGRGSCIVISWNYTMNAFSDAIKTIGLGLSAMGWKH